MKDRQFKDPKPVKGAKLAEIQHPFIWKYIKYLESRIENLEKLLEVRP